MEWKTSPGPVPYQDAVVLMEARARAIREGGADELVWLLEHPALYTAGTSAKASDLLDAQGFAVHQSGRGGQYTYHGPGQRIAYVMLDLKRRTPDVRRYVKDLEHWLITVLSRFGVEGFTREGRVGVWVDTCSHPPSGGTKAGEAKIAALGVRLRQWVTYHGISLNVNPDLSHYRGIVPCGITQYGVTSLAALGVEADMQQVDEALKASFDEIFER